MSSIVLHYCLSTLCVPAGLKNIIISPNTVMSPSSTTNFAQRKHVGRHGGHCIIVNVKIMADPFFPFQLHCTEK